MKRLSRTRRVRTWAVLVGTATILLGVYLCLFHRWRVTAQRDGWVVQYTYLMFKCPHCFGRIERLECNGHPLPLLNFPGADRGAHVMKLTTPVGYFVLPAGDRWRIHYHNDERAETIPDPITAEELKQGWYDTGQERMEGYGTPPRKNGTPAHWCWACGLDRCRWLDPILLERIDWNPMAAAVTTSQPEPGDRQPEP